MSEKFQNFKNYFIWLLVILGFFSLIYYGASNYLQPTKIETITTQSRPSSEQNDQDVKFKKSKKTKPY